MTVQTDNYGIGASGTASQKFTFTAPNDGTFKLGRGVLGAESSFPFVVNADDSISGVFSGLGVGQTWQDVSGSRAMGTNYTNTTGKPIGVSVSFSYVGNGTSSITVDGVVVNSFTYSLGGTGATMSAIIPNGSVYSAAGVKVSWTELR